MEAEYIYCNHCNYEDAFVYVEYSRTVANGDLWVCPECGAEIYNVEPVFEIQ